jgi:hypothetical protein
MTDELAKVEARPIEVRHDREIVATSEVGKLIQLAFQHDKDPTELYALLREERAHQARMEFFAAKAAFLAECPAVVRRSTNSQFKKVSKSGVARTSKYADLDDIQSTIDPVLARHGLTYRWGDAEITDTMIRQKCVLSHTAGHSEEATVSMPHASANKSAPCQQFASASTYARRYSMIAVIGIRGVDDDDDGNGAEPDSVATLTDDHVRSINDTIIQLGADRGKQFRDSLLKWAQVGNVIDIPEHKWAGIAKSITAWTEGAK